MDELTRDGVCRGFLNLWQPKKGYRFNLDSVLLGALAAGMARGVVVDAGAGSGVVGLYVGKATGNRVTLVERQAEWIPVLRRNVMESGVPGDVVRGDFRLLPMADHSVELLVSNPPFSTPGKGRLSPVAHKRASRHTEHGGAPELLKEAERVLRDDGKLVMVLPLNVAEGLRSEVLHRVRVIRMAAKEGAPPDRVLVVYAGNATPVVDEVRAIHTVENRFTPWVDDVLEGRVRTLS